MNKLQLVILTVLLSIISLNIFSQDLTGLWNGRLYNDTTQQYLPYQLAISDDNGKLTGYSYTVFDVEGKPEVGVKKIKIRKKEDKYYIEDNGLLFNDYSIKPPKGVRMLSLVTLKIEPTVMKMSGQWATNRTKIYRPLTGTVEVQKEGNYDTAKLYIKLKELNLANTLSFVPKPTLPIEPTEPVIVIAKPAPSRIKEKKKIDSAGIVVKEKKIKKVKENKIDTAIVAIAEPPAKDVEKRKIINTQEVFYTSDSLTLTLYDNGDVDGDIVTVLMNGEILMPKVSLTTRPVRKTIYITPATADSLQLVMFAENLGSIPPNTGLLVVNDGNAVYEVRFSADLQTNAAILLRKKKK